MTGTYEVHFNKRADGFQVEFVVKSLHQSKTVLSVDTSADWRTDLKGKVPGRFRGFLKWHKKSTLMSTIYYKTVDKQSPLADPPAKGVAESHGRDESSNPVGEWYKRESGGNHDAWIYDKPTGERAMILDLNNGNWRVYLVNKSDKIVSKLTFASEYKNEAQRYALRKLNDI